MDRFQHITDWLPEYVLGTLGERDRRQIAEHLEKCPACKAELSAYQIVIDQLSLAVPLYDPPEELRQDILAAIEQPVRPRESWFERFRQKFSSPVPAWRLAVVMVLFIVTLIGSLFLWQQNQQLLAVRNNDFHVVELKGTAGAPNATGWIVISQNGVAGTLIVQDLPRLTPEQQYQLWLTKDGARVNGGVFNVDGFGYASLWIYTGTPLIEYQRFGITIEPKGGSLDPMGKNVMMNR